MSLGLLGSYIKKNEQNGQRKWLHFHKDMSRILRNIPREHYFLPKLIFAVAHLPFK